MIRKWFSRGAAVLAALCLLGALCCPPALAEGDEETPTVKVGFIAVQGFAQQDADGGVSGVNVEYAYKIAQYANFKIQAVLLQSGREALEQLENGGIDMMCNVLKTSEREKTYLFSEHEAGRLPMCVFTKNDTRFASDDVAQLRLMTFGAEDSSSRVGAEFTAWCAQRGFTPAIVTFDNMDAVEQAVSSGQVDAGLFGAPKVEGFRTIQKFSPIPYYYVFRKSSAELKNEVDDAMTRILSEEPLYFDQLVQKYTNSIEYEMDVLSSEEQAYVADHPTVRVAVLSRDEPYYSAGKNGRPGGILPDFYARIAALTGLSFSYQIYDTQSAAVEAVKNGGADVLGLFSNGQIQANEQGLRLTRPYASVDAVLVTRTGTAARDIQTVAVKSRSQNAVESVAAGILMARYAGYDNARDCFVALQRGQADAMVCGLPSATWLLNQNFASAYNIQTLGSGSLDLCGATAYGSSTLCTLLSKAIGAAAYSFNEIEMNNTLPGDNWETAIARIPPVRVAGIALVLLAGIFIVAWAVISLLRRQKDRAVVLAQKAENAQRENEIAVMEQAAESKNRFFSNISHDMRTPLNAIIGFSQLARETEASPKTRDYLEKIASSGQLLLELINDTLTLSKAGSGKLALHPEAVSAEEVFDSIAVPVRAAAEKKQIQFTADRFGMTQRFILADRLNLQKILLNLLTNAVKYTPEGGHVRFTARNLAGALASPDLLIQVEDDGIGMSGEFLQHLYEPFVQENRPGYEARGTGLGLSIVKQLVDLMGGTITVQSRENQGTVISLRLHFAEPESCAPAPELSSAAPAEPSLSGRKVLLCEDNALNSEIACALLQGKGMQVVTAANGRLGLERFRESAEDEFDLILMDMRMPVMGGLETACAIRALPRPDAARVPILAMTADVFEENVEQCRRAGMDGHVPKPIDPEVLYRALAGALAH